MTTTDPTRPVFDGTITLAFDGYSHAQGMHVKEFDVCLDGWTRDLGRVCTYDLGRTWVAVAWGNNLADATTVELQAKPYTTAQAAAQALADYVMADIAAMNADLDAEVFESDGL